MNAYKWTLIYLVVGNLLALLWEPKSGLELFVMWFSFTFFFMLRDVLVELERIVETSRSESSKNDTYRNEIRDRASKPPADTDPRWLFVPGNDPELIETAREIIKSGRTG